MWSYKGDIFFWLFFFFLKVVEEQTWRFTICCAIGLTYVNIWLHVCIRFTQRNRNNQYYVMDDLNLHDANLAGGATL